jgi:hypothetical protein
MNGSMVSDPVYWEIGGDSLPNFYRQPDNQSLTPSLRDGAYWYAYREYRAPRRPPLRGSIWALAHDAHRHTRGQILY